MTGAPGAEPGSRRRLLSAGAAGAGALVLAGCGDSLKAQLRREPAVAQTDIALLNQLIDLEYRAVAAYTAGEPLLDASDAQAAKLFLVQELAHASGLSVLVREAGSIANKPRGSYDLGAPRSSADVLALLHEIEVAQVAAYVYAIPRLQPEKVRTQTAQYFANDAQHLSVVRSLLDQPPLPAAFVTGRE